MRPRVNTQKHIIQNSLFAVASGAITNLVLANAVVAPTTAGQVREGAIISAIYVEMWLTSDDTAAGTVVVTLEKLPGNSPTMTTANAGALHDYNNKKNIFFTQMGLLPSNVDYPMASIKGWIKIPKGKQRFTTNDALILNIFGQSNGVAGCGFSIFKEQY